jgi:hypothetical protein
MDSSQHSLLAACFTFHSMKRHTCYGPTVWSWTVGSHKNNPPTMTAQLQEKLRTLRLAQYNIHTSWMIVFFPPHLYNLYQPAIWTQMVLWPKHSTPSIKCENDRNAHYFLRTYAIYAFMATKGPSWKYLHQLTGLQKMMHNFSAETTCTQRKRDSFQCCQIQRPKCYHLHGS